MSDLIDRQAAIDALADQLYHSAEDYRTAVKVIGNLPSAQPIDVQVAYYRGKIDGIKECRARLKKMNEEFANE